MHLQSGSAAIDLGPRPSSAAQARSFLRSRLAALAVPPPLLEDAVLLTSELVANAVLHARTDIEIRLDSTARRVRVQVHDGNSRLPVIATVPADATSGRGLLLVRELASDWGIEPSPSGKAVWFELHCTTG